MMSYEDAVSEIISDSTKVKTQIEPQNMGMHDPGTNIDISIAILPTIWRLTKVHMCFP